MLVDFLEPTKVISVNNKESAELECSTEMLVDFLKPTVDISVNNKENNEPDTHLIANEEFDFDIPVSPSKCAEADAVLAAPNEDQEDKVFFGPVGFTEKCIAAGVEEKVIKPFSPLRPDQWAQLAKEAFQVAYHIGSLKPSDTSASESDDTTSRMTPRRSRRHLGHLFQTPGMCASSPLGKADENKSTSVIFSETLQTNGSRKRGTEQCDADNLCSPEKQRKRTGTFTVEKPVETVASSETATEAGKKLMQDATLTKSVDKINSARVERRVSQTIEAAVVAPPKTSAGAASKLKPPTSRLQRYNNSQPNLAQLKSGLPPRQGFKLALGLSSTLQSLDSQPAEEKKKDDEPTSTNSRRSSGIPTNKGMTTKLQLLHPGQLQRRSFAIGRGKGSTAPAQSGPLKATALPAPSVGRPSVAAAAGNSQCPTTPVGLKGTQLTGSSLSSEGLTPARSSYSSSSVCNSTPGSVNKRVSMLPTPSKCRSLTESLPPPSPMGLRSIGSLASVSSSDAGDSPFSNPKLVSRLLRNPQSSGVKPRMALVQYTPDLPKKTLSQWSPVRRPKPALLEDQVSMCTKRLNKQ